MTLSRICDYNFKAIQNSLEQPGRIHVYGDYRVVAHRKIGRHFQFKTTQGGWITCNDWQDLRIYVLSETDPALYTQYAGPQ
jgi:hypothetical protein